CIANGSGIYFRALYSNFKNYGDRWAYTLVDNTPGIQLLNPANTGCATDSSGVTTANCTAPPSFNTQLRNPNIGIGSMVLGGAHDFTNSHYSWEVSASRSFYGNSPYSTAVFDSTLSSSSCQYDAPRTVHVYLPQWTPECYAEAYNPA